MKSPRALCWALGGALIFAGIFMPRGWYDSASQHLERVADVRVMRGHQQSSAKTRLKISNASLNFHN
jgi:hypothetical protein